MSATGILAPEMKRRKMEALHESSFQVLPDLPLPSTAPSTEDASNSGMLERVSSLVTADQRNDFGNSHNLVNIYSWTNVIAAGTCWRTLSFVMSDVCYRSKWAKQAQGV